MHLQYLKFAVALLNEGNPQVQHSVFFFFKTNTKSEALFARCQETFTEKIEELRQLTSGTSVIMNNKGTKGSQSIDSNAANNNNE